jgi:hypothetical protein
LELECRGEKWRNIPGKGLFQVVEENQRWDASGGEWGKYEVRGWHRHTIRQWVRCVEAALGDTIRQWVRCLP